LQDEEGYEDGNGGAIIVAFSAACDRDLATSSLNELLGHPETNTASQVTLCGEKRFEDVFQMPPVLFLSHCPGP